MGKEGAVAAQPCKCATKGEMQRALHGCAGDDCRRGIEHGYP